MSKSMIVSLTSALALGSAALAGGNEGPAAQANCRTIADLVATNPQFSTLRTALNQAGLTATFQNRSGAFTVFAPTNAAFAKLPAADLQAVLNDRATLTKVLQYHVVAGKVNSRQVVTLDSANTLADEIVTVSSLNNMVMINDARVVQANINACNGIVHVIDTVLLPPGLALGATAAPAPAATTTTTTTTTNTTAARPAAPAASNLPTAITVAQIPARPLGPRTTTPTATAPAAPATTTTDTTATAPAAPATTTTTTTDTTATAPATTTTTDTTATAPATTTDTTATAPATTTDTSASSSTTTTAPATTTTTTDTTATAPATTTTTTDTTAQSNTTTSTTGTTTTTATTQSTLTIAEVVATDPRFTTLRAALDAAGLTSLLVTGDYTVLAPTNEAFAKIPAADLQALLADKEKLTVVLQYHVLPGRVTTTQLANPGPVRTSAPNQTVTTGTSGSTVKVGQANVVQGDIQAVNGVVQVIDSVLVPTGVVLGNSSTNAGAAQGNTVATGTTTATPPTGNPGGSTATPNVATNPGSGGTGSVGTTAAGALPATPAAPATTTSASGATTTTTTTTATGTTTATNTQTIAAIVASDPRFSTLRTALDAAGLTSLLASGDYTVLAPTNDAFAKLPKAQLDALLADRAALTRVLQYHVLPGRQTSAQIRGATGLTTALPNQTLTFGSAVIVQGDIQAANGVVQVIDTVLLPPTQ